MVPAALVAATAMAVAIPVIRAGVWEGVTIKAIHSSLIQASFAGPLAPRVALAGTAAAIDGPVPIGDAVAAVILAKVTYDVGVAAVNSTVAAVNDYFNSESAEDDSDETSSTADPTGEVITPQPDAEPLSGGRSGENVKNLTGKPNSAIRGTGDQIYITNDKGQVIRDVTGDRVKEVIPGVGFGPKRNPTEQELDLLDQLRGR